MKLPLTIRDSVHGDIEIIEEIAVKLINTPEFQRLRRISQLAGDNMFFQVRRIRVFHIVLVFIIWLVKC